MAVRRESVRLELQDAGFSTGMVKNAAATGLLERALKSLDGTTVNVHQSISESATGVDNFSRSAKNADGSINQLTGRLRVLGEVAAILAPTIAPIGGVAIAGIGGLANQMGIAAVAGGVLIGAMQGVGDALGAMNKAQLEPTEKNLQKAKDALEALSPAARDFAEQAFALKPALVALRDLGAEELFPGLTASLDNLSDLGPRVAGIMQAFGGALGDIAEDSSASLASERWADFFEFIRVEGPKTLTELATTVGDLTHGLAELWQAFEPLNSDFSSWLMNVADGFDDWATGLSATEGFTEFVDYIRETGPQVADTLGAMFNAIVQLVQASAPLGGPVLAGIEAFSNAVAAIADSDLGTPIMAGVTALALLNRTLAVTAALSKTSLSSGMFAGIGAASKGVKGAAGSFRSDLADMSDGLVAFGANADKASAATDRMKGRLAAGAGLAGVAVAATGAADSIGLTNTASLALMGTLGGPPGVAIGAAVGALLDFRAAGEQATQAIEGLDAAIQSGDPAILTEQLAAAKEELAAFKLDDMNVLSDVFGNVFGADSAIDTKTAKIKVAEQALEDLAWQEKAAGIAAKGAALELLTTTGANVDLAKWSGKSTEQIKAQAKALGDAQAEAQQTADSFVGLGESLNDGKTSLRDWIKDMASTADALNNFTTNSIRAGKRGLEDGLIRQLQLAGPEGARRMRQLANGTESEIARANAAFLKGEKAAERYNNYKVPPKKITADPDRALQSFREVDVAMDGLAARPPVVLEVITAYSTTGRQVNPDGPFRPGLADGGTVPGPRQPYGDKIHAMLAPGEEIISNRFGQADRFRADRAAGLIPGYADGGTSGDKPGKRKSSGGLFVVDRTDSLEEAIRRLTLVAEGQTTALEDATARTERWSEKMSEVARATVAGFDTGLFERDSNPWAAGSGGGPLANLTRDIAGLNERSGLQAQLAGMGLSGDSLAALLSQGSNADLSGLINSGQVSQYAALYAQRAALQGSVGAAGGQAAYGAAYSDASAAQKVTADAARQTNVELATLNGRLAQMEKALASVPERIGVATGSSVRGEAVKGHRDKKARGGPVR